MMKRISTFETLRKRRSRRNLHAPSLTRFHTPHPTPPLDPLQHLSHLPHNPLPPQNHSPPDCWIFFSLIEPIFTPLQSSATSLRMLPKCRKNTSTRANLLTMASLKRRVLQTARMGPVRRGLRAKMRARWVHAAFLASKKQPLFDTLVVVLLSNGETRKEAYLRGHDASACSNGFGSLYTNADRASLIFRLAAMCCCTSACFSASRRSNTSNSRSRMRIYCSFASPSMPHSTPSSSAACNSRRCCSTFSAARARSSSS